jgi:hypothetical protein
MQVDSPDNSALREICSVLAFSVGGTSGGRVAVGLPLPRGRLEARAEGLHKEKKGGFLMVIVAHEKEGAVIARFAVMCKGGHGEGVWGVEGVEVESVDMVATCPNGVDYSCDFEGVNGEWVTNE